MSSWFQKTILFLTKAPYFSLSKSSVSSIHNFFKILVLLSFPFCQDQFQLPSSVQVQLRNEISLKITVKPPHHIRASIFEPLLNYLES